MASAAPQLSEPHVLAHTKRRLFSDSPADNSYAVVDTQFSRDEWLHGEQIAPEIHDTLSPFNHVRLGSGYPDLVGVTLLGSEFVAVDRVGTESPLIAIEAKGHKQNGTVDTQRGLIQAYDRLHEANAAYLAAPSASISQTDRTLARELNVGVLAVSPSGTVEPLEIPRIVGSGGTDETRAIRFQASAQGVTDASFGLNHPKNYLGYPLAHYAAGSTADLLAEYQVVGAAKSARRGAAFLDLIEERPEGVRLRPLGQEVVRFAISRYGSVEAALSTFEDWYRSRKRFDEVAPEWGQLARRVVFGHPATQLLVTELQCLHEDQQPKPTLVELVSYLHALHPTFTVELFIRGDEAVRRRVLSPDGDLNRSTLDDGMVYHSPTVFQLKAILYHVGLLTERGSEPTRLDPSTDIWALCDPV